MTSDKDFLSTCFRKHLVYRPETNGASPTEVWGIKEVLEKFPNSKSISSNRLLRNDGRRCRQYTWGHRVGRRSAQKFISEYGSMEVL